MSRDSELEKVLDTDFLVSHQTDNSYTMNKLHFHDVFEIYYAGTGGLKYFVDNRIYPVEKGDLFVFNHLDLHRIGIPQGTWYERYVLVFNQEYIQGLCTAASDLLRCFLNRDPRFNHRAHLTEKQAGIFLGLFEKADRYLKSSEYGDDIYRKITLAEILIFVNCIYQNNKQAFSAQHDTPYVKIKPILNYISDHLDLKLSLEHLANRFYISKFHLCKIFKEATGFTLNEYIINRRIIRATELLRKDYLVAQVAEMTGFHDDSYFITTFKKIVGLSPKQYALKGI
jgi:AraC-like DNA-binding protein